MNENDPPTRPDLVLRLGFVGNRELPEDPEGHLVGTLRGVVEIVARRLAAISPNVEIPPMPENVPVRLIEYFSDSLPRLHLVSGLAEGADALAANLFQTLEGENRGKNTTQYSQSGVIGFPYAAYRDGRDPGFRAEFERLAAACTHVLALDGPELPYPHEDKKQDTLLDKDRRSRAYRAQTELILRNSDLLVAVADRSKDGLAGGTLEAVRAAQAFRVPVLFLSLETAEVPGAAPKRILTSVGATFIEPDETMEGAVTAEQIQNGITTELKNEIEHWATILVAGPALSFLARSNPGRSSLVLDRQLEYLEEFFDQPEVPPQYIENGKSKRRASWQERWWERLQEIVKPWETRVDTWAEHAKEWKWAWKRLKIELRTDAKKNLAAWDESRKQERERQRTIPAEDHEQAGRKPDRTAKQDGANAKRKEFERPAVNRWRRRATDLNYHYAGLYRGTFVATYLLAIVAVALAGISLLVLGGQGGFAADLRSAASHHESPSGCVESEPNMGLLLILALAKIGCVLGILWLTTLGNSRRWNDRAINYRYLAERLRVMHLFPRLGSFQPPAAGVSQSASRALDQGIFDWLFDAILRSADAGLWTSADGGPSAKPAGGPRLIATEPHQVASLARLFLVGEQIDYHRGNHQKMHRLSEALEIMGKLLNGAVIGIVALDIGLIVAELTHPPAAIGHPIKLISAWLVFFAGLLPAAVAAIHGLRYQSECQRLSDRSQMMTGILENHRHHFDKLLKRMEQYRGKPAEDPGSWTAEVLHATEACARDLIEEAAEWTVLYSKEINEP